MGEVSATGIVAVAEESADSQLAAAEGAPRAAAVAIQILSTAARHRLTLRRIIAAAQHLSVPLVKIPRSQIACKLSTIAVLTQQLVIGVVAVAAAPGEAAAARRLCRRRLGLGLGVVVIAGKLVGARLVGRRFERFSVFDSNRKIGSPAQLLLAMCARGGAAACC